MARMIGRIEVGAVAAPPDAQHPYIRIRVRDAALAERLEASIAERLAKTMSQDPLPPPCRRVRVAALPAATAARDGIAIIPVTRRTGRRLLALAEAAESAGAAGIQLVWTGKAPELEAPVFQVLEAWRGASRQCPLVLAPDAEPAEALLRAIARGNPSGLAKPGDPMRV